MLWAEFVCLGPSGAVWLRRTPRFYRVCPPQWSAAQASRRAPDRPDESLCCAILFSSSQAWTSAQQRELWAHPTCAAALLQIGPGCCHRVCPIPVWSGAKTANGNYLVRGASLKVRWPSGLADARDLEDFAGAPRAICANSPRVNSITSSGSACQEEIRCATTGINCKSSSTSISAS